MGFGLLVLSTSHCFDPCFCLLSIRTTLSLSLVCLSCLLYRSFSLSGLNATSSSLPALSLSNVTCFFLISTIMSISMDDGPGSTLQPLVSLYRPLSSCLFSCTTSGGGGKVQHQSPARTIMFSICIRPELVDLHVLSWGSGKMMTDDG